jgi:bacterioferritin-associated ferredoxin
MIMSFQNIADKPAMSDDDLVCFCMSVTRGEIKAEVRKGASSVDELKASLYCCTGCGTCEGRVQKLLDETKATQEALNEALKKAV